MNEAARKPAQTAPESYSPKKPELLNMAKQIQSNPFRPISDFSGENGIYEMPPARFIGIRHNHMPGTKGRKQLGDFIDSTFQSKTWKDVVMNLPNVLCGEAGDFTCEYVPETDSFSFIVGVFAPAGTPVPEGLDSRDVPATLVWVSKKEGGKGKEIPDGYETNFDAPGFPWQAFLRADTYAILPIKDIFTAARPAPASNSPLGARRAPDACPAP